MTHGLLLVVFIVEFQLAFQLRFLLFHQLLVLVLLFLVQNVASLAPILISAWLEIALQQHQKGFEASDLFLFFLLHILAAWSRLGSAPWLLVVRASWRMLCTEIGRAAIEVSVQHAPGLLGEQPAGLVPE